MQKLRRSRTYPGAHKPTYVPFMRLPLGWAMFVIFGGGYTLITFSDWRWWIIVALVWTAIYIALRIVFKRDHNKMRILSLSLSKLFDLGDKIWGGSTQFSWPVVDRTPTPRGIPFRGRFQ